MRAKRSGVVANISSIGAWRGGAGAGLYCASKWAVSGISETLYAELAEFNIQVCTVEPGYFRSGFLNPGHKIVRQQTIADYDGSAVRKGEEMLEAADNQQPGDINKGAKVIIDVLTGATGRPIPMRLALGSDAYPMIKAKCEETIQGLNEWKEISCSTNIE